MYSTLSAAISVFASADSSPSIPASSANLVRISDARSANLVDANIIFLRAYTVSQFPFHFNRSTTWVCRAIVSTISGMPHRRPYLTSPKWARTRRRILDRDKWRCVECGAAARLQIDHVLREKAGGARFDEGTFRPCVENVTARRPAERTAPRCLRIKPTGCGTSWERKCFEPSLPLAPAGLRPWGPSANLAHDKGYNHSSPIGSIDSAHALKTRFVPPVPPCSPNSKEAGKEEAIGGLYV